MAQRSTYCVYSAREASSHKKFKKGELESVAVVELPLCHSSYSSNPPPSIPLLPTPAFIPRRSPVVGQVIYMLWKNLLHCWKKATIHKIIMNETTQQMEYVVHYKPTKKPGYLARRITLKEMAYDLPCPYMLPVGARVIAKYVDENRSEDDGMFYAGVVADYPKITTKNRYLIFFDDGSAQYVSQEAVFLVFESSKDVWNDVYPTSYNFIQNYIIEYPECLLVRLKEGSLVSVEWNGLCHLVRVLEVDYALAKVQFETDERIEWIYRGSGRFLLDCNKADVSSRTVQPDLLVEYQGSIKKVIVPAHAPRPRQLQSHRCSSNCITQYFRNAELDKLSPLAVPLFLGWSREVVGLHEKEVLYVAPCGVRLSNYSELTKYLLNTDCNMPVDYFYFGTGVNILDEFVPAHVLLKVDDFSHGKESRPVEIVNALDPNNLPDFKYITQSEASHGVAERAKRTFLTCCDCTDNCMDASKCACLKLTMERLAIWNTNSTTYQNRRLNGQVTGGLYECNDICKCKMTCLNRVVQSGSMWPLQIFNTARKGWGVRALHDIPNGSFLCTYTGELLTDEEAKMRDERYDSTYMANLNYARLDEDGKPEGTKKKQLTSQDYNDCLQDDCFVVDARVNGNASRFFNVCSNYSMENVQAFYLRWNVTNCIFLMFQHTCDPNVILQHVFSDTHNVRFPQLAFFTTCLVKAGSELGFDYGYKVGSVPGKQWYCSCRTPYCQGRFL
ncbi:Histone-lysine N-methyltransferase eggless [Orchesella cincta]|uniref:Histone-lysine N-methyltransferase eggless n=1 Tax=Orchesella cincta TaxID=48709 RepID=A0A1D2MCJ8_ORCCI|nr:Histone-lysine N-methyltransferase eggless [Orchesella cincta]